ncbi:MAG: hypothetical protein ACE5K2_09690, partial [Candidatus Zixiibacteriota bacterium]
KIKNKSRTLFRRLKGLLKKPYSYECIRIVILRESNDRRISLILYEDSSPAFGGVRMTPC